MLGTVLAFMVFGAAGLVAVIRSDCSLERWLIVPPVSLALAFTMGRLINDNPVRDLLLSGMMMIFAAAAVGALWGGMVGQMIQTFRQSRETCPEQARFRHDLEQFRREICQSRQEQ